MTDVRAPRCPGCDQLPAMVLGEGTQAFCGNDDCRVLCWDMTDDPARFKAQATIVEWATKSELWPDGRPQWAEGDLAAKRIEGGEWLVLRPLLFGASLCVCGEGCAGIEVWQFNESASLVDSTLFPIGLPPSAYRAWRDWPAPPTGWSRHQLRDGSRVWPDRRTES